MSLKGELYNWYKGGQLGKGAKQMIVVRSVGAVMMFAGATWVHPGIGLFIIGVFLLVPQKKDEDAV
jgi:hypothetical protein